MVPNVEAAKPAQERQASKVANLVAGTSGQDSTITADKHTVTYRANVPPGTTDDQMQKIMTRLQEKVMNDNNSSAMINGKPIGSGATKLNVGGAAAAACKSGAGGLGSDAANEVRAASAEQKKRADEAKVEAEK